MKDSGMVWIGCVPEQWKRYRLRYLCEMKTGGTPEDKYGINDDGEGYPWITAPDINETYRISSYSQYINDKAIKQCNYKLFPPNSTLLVCIASVGKLGLIEEYCYANQQITALIPNQFIEPEFLMYYIQAMSVKIIDDASSNVVPIINSQYLKNICVFIPDLLEQKRITAFINKRVVLTNSILSDLQEQIEILDNYKKSLITETVTKGLNPKVSMKDSGIEWIGYIPNNWEVCRIKNKYQLVTGFTPDTTRAEYYDDEHGLTWISIADIPDNNKYVYDSKSKISEIYIKEKHPEIVKKGSLLYSFKLSVGKTVFAGDDCYTNEAIASFKDNENVVLPFLYYSAYLIEENSNINIYGAKILNQDLIKNAVTVFPPIKEQQEIAKYLDDKIRKINCIIDSKISQIEKLEDYKKSLIFEYVTGKKRVKEAM